MDPQDQLTEYLVHATHGVAFTGAGISTESGIADFRSPGGLWDRHKPVYYDEFVASRAARVRYWKTRIELYKEFANAEPNTGHHAIAQLEDMGKLAAVVTQNIDGLHQLGGSRRVIELHGTARIIACIQCGKEWAPTEIHALIESGDDAPDCDVCGAPLKSKTVSFGQAMPEKEMAEATQLSQEADLYLAIGSSLVVEPAASLPRLAKNHGATLVIVNNTPTPLDAVADLVIREPIGRTLQSVLGALDQRKT